MRIIEDIKLDFSDVLIVPKTSTLTSRWEVSVKRAFQLKHANWSWAGVPIIAANMDTVGTIEMADALSELDMCTALHKHYTVEELNSYLFLEHDNKNKNVFYSMGITDKDFEKLGQYTFKGSAPSMVCLDVANGYTMAFLDAIKKLREYVPGAFIMAGNVVTPEKTEQVILAGADMVKVGIGPGCLAENSRILMANGTYKNIQDVKPGDRIITMNGTPATVKKSFSTGIRKVISVKNASFNKELVLTPDHKCYVGDLKTTSYSTIQSRGYSSLLQLPTKNNESKLKWKEIVESKDRTTALLPSKIKWEIPDSFEYDISSYFTVDKYKKDYNIVIKSSYDLGYMFGFFLGDGNSHTHTHTTKNGNSTSGRIEFNIFKNDIKYIEKITQIIKDVTGKEPVLRYDNTVCVVTLYSKQWAHIFTNFFKKAEKHLPEKYYCLDKKYLQGLYDGLMDSDGNFEDEKSHKFTNTSQQIIELYGFLTYNLFGYFPYYTSGRLNHSKLVEARTECYRCKHTVTGGQIKTRVMDNYQIVKLTNFEDRFVEVPVYDLEIDDESHSFIANNMIVHNSVCTTRKMTGVGYPQLSAIMDCADAAHGLNGLVCADGGCTVPGDVVKAFAAGADFVMLGGMFAGTDESGGEKVFVDHKNDFQVHETERHGKLFPPSHVRFYGMSSKKANETYNGGLSNYKAAEGKEVLVPYKGSVKDVAQEILGGLRSAMTYVGATKLKELTKRTTFVRVNNQLNNVFTGKEV